MTATDVLPLSPFHAAACCATLVLLGVVAVRLWARAAPHAEAKSSRTWSAMAHGKLEVCETGRRTAPVDTVGGLRGDFDEDDEFSGRLISPDEALLILAVIERVYCGHTSHSATCRDLRYGRRRARAANPSMAHVTHSLSSP